MKRALSFILAFSLMFLMCACGSKGSDDNSSETKQMIVPQKPTFTNVGENGSRTDDAVGFQLEAPKVGEKVVVFETDKGQIVMRVFKDSAPITVTNFVGLVENGYYDGISFHRVIDGFMIQGGDPTATGSGGESVWGEDFEDEFNANLINIRGSVAMANSGVNTNGSQFFINQRTTAENESDLNFDTLYNGYYTGNKTALTNNYNELVKQKGDEITDVFPDAESYVKSYIEEYICTQLINSKVVPDEVWALYKKHGGNITLDGAWKTAKGHSVFAQVVIGMDVVDEISKVSTDDNDKPLKTVTIKKAYTTEFTAEMLSNVDNYIITEDEKASSSEVTSTEASSQEVTE